MSDHTVQRYLDILAGTFMIRLLPPWHVNVRKRLVKRPKVYLRDSGVFHVLPAIDTPVAVQQHVKLGASWEGGALEQVIRTVGLPDDRVFFFGRHTPASKWICSGRHTLRTEPSNANTQMRRA